MCRKNIKCYWERCPSEIIFVIFEYLNTKTLLNCMVVNKRWFCIISTMFAHKGWMEVVRKVFADSGGNFRKKSDLSWRSIVINHCLWQCIAEARAVYIHDFKTDDKILNVHIYRGTLIVVKATEVLYVNVENIKITKKYTYTYVDYDENDHMIIAVEEIDGLKRLSICLKYDQRRFPWNEKSVESFSVVLYKLGDSCCYITKSNNSLFRIKWANGTWNEKLLAKYYGHGVITDIALWEEEVYILLDWGGLLQVDHDLCKFNTGFNFNIQRGSNLKMFMKSGLVMPGRAQSDSEITTKWQDTQHWILQCPNLTCSLQHGNILLLGYKNGRVEIFTLENLMKCNHPKPNLTLDVHQFAEDLDDPCVRSVEVREVDGGHNIFIVTRTNIQLVELVYPESLRMFMLESCK